MKRNTLLSAILALVMLAAACGGSSSGNAGGKANGTAKKTQETTEAAYSPHINPADFTRKIDNKYFPLKLGTTFVYRGKTKDATEGDVVTVTSDTKNIMGVECVVVNDRVTEDGKLTEQTYDWYAQDKEGNVWYFGEDSKEYENGKVTSTEGSWEADKNGAKPGIIMPADPKVGDTYRQEYYKGVAEDMARPLKLDGSATVPYGSFDHALVTYEWTPLEPNIAEQKYYAPGVGTILEVAVKGPPERLELVDVKHG
jgi:major membrane immunogen (membrane-anchored lipoprotein)